MVNSLKQVFENIYKTLLSFHRDVHQDLSDLEVVYTETDPNGSLKAKRGKMAVYWTGAAYVVKMNVDGGNTWATLT